MKKSDLYREWARVLDMCEGTEVTPHDCAKYDGKLFNKEYRYSFNFDPNLYTFAAAILDNKPVFVGDTIYHKVGQIPYKVGYGDSNFDNTCWSWNPTNETLPCPQKDWTPFNLDLNTWRMDGRLSGMRYYFKDEVDVVKAAAVIRKLLQDATK